MRFVFKRQKEGKNRFRENKNHGSRHGLFLIFRFWRSSSVRKPSFRPHGYLMKTHFHRPAENGRSEAKTGKKPHAEKRGRGERRQSSGEPISGTRCRPAGKKTPARFPKVETRHGAGEKNPDPGYPVVCQVKNKTGDRRGWDRVGGGEEEGGGGVRLTRRRGGTERGH